MAGGQSGWPGRNQQIVQGMANADTFTVAPYLLHDIPANASTDAIFGALFAQPEMMAEGGVTAQNLVIAKQAPAKPMDISIYETNLHSTEGSPAQATLDAVVPSVGAGVAIVSEMLQNMRLGARSQALFTLTQWQFKRSDGLHVPLWGAVVDMGVTNRRRPQFLAVELANTAIAGAMTQTFQGGDNPVWNETSGIDGVKFQNAHELQSFAFRDGDKRSVVLINLSRSDALPVDFVGAIQPHGRVEMSQLVAAKITDSNEDAEKVKIVSSIQSFSAGQRITVPPFSVMVLRWTGARAADGASR
ncbi:MAG TPA: hypothetical protein VNU94_05915, partial [Acidobacteriaceae bacterium]|nr:hypothetical protein [Acidobacteriaceae bacterium]